MRRLRSRGLGALVVAATITVSPFCFAEPTEDPRAGAEALFEEGLRLFDAKDYEAACARFAASQRLEPTPGAQLSLARCLEAEGKTASAWSAYVEAVLVARRASDPKREKLAMTKEAALMSVAPKLTIRLAPETRREGLEIRRNGARVDEALWSVAVPIDPGSWEIVASAPGSRTRTQTIALRDGESKTLVVDPLDREDAAPRPSPRQEHGSRRILAFVAGGAGLAAIGAGTYFGLHAKSLHDDASSRCSGDACDAAGVSLVDRAGKSADLATAFFVSGAALAVVATVLFVTSAPRARE